MSGRLHRLHEPVEGIQLVFSYEEKRHLTQRRLFSEEMVAHGPYRPNLVSVNLSWSSATPTVASDCLGTWRLQLNYPLKCLPRR